MPLNSDAVRRRYDHPLLQALSQKGSTRETHRRPSPRCGPCITPCPWWWTRCQRLPHQPQDGRLPLPPLSCPTRGGPCQPVALFVPQAAVNPLYSQPQPTRPSAVAVSGMATERQLVLTGTAPSRRARLLSRQAGRTRSPATIVAVRQFQADRSLEPDGVVNGALLVRLAEQVVLRAKTS